VSERRGAATAAKHASDSTSDGPGFCPLSTLTNNFYVDDALCGASTIEDALRLQQELIGFRDKEDFAYASFVPVTPAY
jgi:hypothetical protein